MYTKWILERFANNEIQDEKAKQEFLKVIENISYLKMKNWVQICMAWELKEAFTKAGIPSQTRINLAKNFTKYLTDEDMQWLRQL